jgi:hypothetical protein
LSPNVEWTDYLSIQPNLWTVCQINSHPVVSSELKNFDSPTPHLLHPRGGEVCTWELGIYGKCRRLSVWMVAAIIAERLTDGGDGWGMADTWRRRRTKCRVQTLKAVLGPSALYPYHAPPADRRFLTGFLTILRGAWLVRWTEFWVAKTSQLRLAHYQTGPFITVAIRQRNETPSAKLTTALPTLLKIRRPLKACGFKSLSGHQSSLPQPWPEDCRADLSAITPGATAEARVQRAKAGRPCSRQLRPGEPLAHCTGCRSRFRPKPAETTNVRGLRLGHLLDLAQQVAELVLLDLQVRAV